MEKRQGRDGRPCRNTAGSRTTASPGFLKGALVVWQNPEVPKPNRALRIRIMTQEVMRTMMQAKTEGHRLAHEKSNDPFPLVFLQMRLPI
jgi:hypothetical protein